jgi:hypothetical protein
VVKLADGEEYGYLISDGDRAIREFINMTRIDEVLNLEGAVWRYES